MKFQQKEINCETIVLGEKECHTLGPDLNIVDCELVIQCRASLLTITNASFVNCRIVAKRKLSNCQSWCSAKFVRCSFAGNFIGNDFGYWLEQSTYGGLKDCDFRNAKMHLCRLMNCDVANMMWPTWPSFAMLHPRSNAALMDTAALPGRMRNWLKLAKSELADTSALIDDARALVDRYGGDVSMLRSYLEQYEFVVIH